MRERDEEGHPPLVQAGGPRGDTESSGDSRRRTAEPAPRRRAQGPTWRPTLLPVGGAWPARPRPRERHVRDAGVQAGGLLQSREAAAIAAPQGSGGEERQQSTPPGSPRASGVGGSASPEHHIHALTVAPWERQQKAQMSKLGNTTTILIYTLHLPTSSELTNPAQCLQNLPRSRSLPRGLKRKMLKKDGDEYDRTQGGVSSLGTCREQAALIAWRPLWTPWSTTT